MLGCLDDSALPALLSATDSLLCLFQSLSAVPLGNIPWFWHLPLRSLTSLGFVFTASHNGLLGTPLPHLASEALNPRGRFPQSFSSCIPHHCRVRATWTTLPGDWLPTCFGGLAPRFSEAFLCYRFLGTKNSPGLSYLPIGRFAFYFLMCSFHFGLYIFISFSLCALFHYGPA